MATTVDYKHADPELGIYALYNDFFGIANRTGATVFNLTYMVKVTSLYNSEFVEKPISPIGTYAVFNPFELVKETFFKSEYIGIEEHTQPFAYNKIKVEVGASFGATANVPPTFEGYVTSDTFYVYNGYEMPPIVENYRNPNWYDTLPIKLPKVKKTLYLLESDIELLSFPSQIQTSGMGELNAINLIQVFYDSNGNVVLTAPTGLVGRPSLFGIGYWNININAALIDGSSYLKAYIEYEDSETGETFVSEEITIYHVPCLPKQDNHRLFFINRYGGSEYENFQLKSDEELRITKGKKIQSDGVNYLAQTFADIKNINNPNLKEFGNTAARFRTLRTNWLTQEQVDALQELYKSSVVIMNGNQSVIVQDTSYRIERVKDGLVQVDVTVQIANNEPIQRQ